MNAVVETQQIEQQQCDPPKFSSTNAIVIQHSKNHWKRDRSQTILQAEPLDTQRRDRYSRNLKAEVLIFDCTQGIIEDTYRIHSVLKESKARLIFDTK